MTAELAWTCAGCGAEVGLEEPRPFRCPSARPGDDVEHVLRPRAFADEPELPWRDDPNPFVRFRSRSVAWRLARARGMSDEDYVALARDLAARAREVDGHEVAVTPFFYSAPLDVWLKDETRGLAESHKARHLMGTALYLEVARRTGLSAPEDADAPLAIASCGNAALAAATVARASGRRLRVFLPDWADEEIRGRLAALGAEEVVCRREADGPPGDPAYRAFLRAVDEGHLPFSVQGNRNALAIDGGMTLGFELAEQLEAAAPPPVARLFVQVGGGALASSTLQALRAAHASEGPGRLSVLPRLFAVQTQQCRPLVDAWSRVVQRALELVHERLGERPPDARDANDAHDAGLAAFLHHPSRRPCVELALAEAARRRSWFMRPVEQPPCSVATGILDDETYDGYEIVRGMLATGGFPVAVSEVQLTRARDLGRAHTDIEISATGAAGLAGLIALRERGLGGDEPAACLFTGVWG